MPKRLGHILEKVADFNNIELADINARKGKHNPGIIKHDYNREVENIELSLDLIIKLMYQYLENEKSQRNKIRK